MARLARFPGTTGDYASCPDNAAFSGLDDFSVIWLGSADDWTPSANNNLASHYNGAANQQSWFLHLATTGVLRLNLSTSGSSGTNHDSTAATGFSDGTVHWILVTRNATTGDVKFYTATYTAGSVTPPAIGSFSQLGSTVSGVTGTLFNSNNTLNVGAIATGTAPLDGDVYRTQLYTGIYGSGSETLVRDFNPNDAASLASTSWTAGTTGETWTLNGGDVTLVAGTVTGTAAIAGSGAIAATGLPVHSGTAAVSGAGAVAGAGVTVVSGSAAISGSGAVAAAGTRVTDGTGVVAGAGAVAATGLRVVSGTAAVAGSGAIAAEGEGTTPSGEVNGTGAISGSGAVAATGTRVVSGSAAVSGSGDVAASGTRVTTGSAAITGSGSISASGESPGAEPEPEPEPRPGGGKTWEPSRETLDFWESEAQRLRVLRDDEELLLLV